MCIAEAAEKLVAQLTNQFPAAHLMDAFRLIYPQYWSDKEADVNFDRHLKILKKHYGSAKPFSTANHPEGQVEPMLSPTVLDMQSSLFKQCMKENSTSMLKKPFNENPVTRIRRCIDANSFLRHSLSEFIKVAEIGICLVLGCTGRAHFQLCHFHEDKAEELAHNSPATRGWYEDTEFL
jgi:hypothetical protein